MVVVSLIEQGSFVIATRGSLHFYFVLLVKRLQFSLTVTLLEVLDKLLFDSHWDHILLLHIKLFLTILCVIETTNQHLVLHFTVMLLLIVEGYMV